MRIYVSIPEALALLEIVDEHIERNFPGVEPPTALRKVKDKFGRAVATHRKEIAAVITASKTIVRMNDSGARQPRASGRAAAKRSSGR
jgi:hypothetical protein